MVFQRAAMGDREYMDRLLAMSTRAFFAAPACLYIVAAGW